MLDALSNSQSCSLEPFSDFPPLVCKYLSPEDLVSASRVSKLWCESVIDEETKRLQQYVQEKAFGFCQWTKHLGKVDPAALDLKIWRILHQKCPFSSDALVKDTHILFLFPKNLEQQEFSLGTFRNHLQLCSEKDVSIKLREGLSHMSGSPPRYCHADTPDPMDSLEYTQNYEGCSYFVLMFQGLMSSSKNKPFSDQKKMLSQHPQYTVPRVCEAAMGILFSDMSADPRSILQDTYTSCEHSFPIGYFGLNPVIIAGEYQRSIVNVDTMDKSNSSWWISGKHSTFSDPKIGIAPTQRFVPPKNTKRSCSLMYAIERSAKFFTLFFDYSIISHLRNKKMNSND